MRFRVQLVFVSVLILGLSFTASAQSERVIEANSITFKMDFFDAPSLPVTGGIQVPGVSGMKWLTAMITYVPTLTYENSKRSGGNGKKRVRWLDDLSVTLHVIIPSTPDYGNYALLSGKQVLWSVPEDGQTHRVFFAVPPQILKRYGVFDKVNKTIASGIPAVVEFRNKDQVLLARYIYIPKGQNQQNVVRMFSQIMGSNVGFLKLPDAVLPKERTPWNLVEIDSFDLSKSSVEGK